jgi:cytosine/uracil/thiamine/allantoin permease
MFGDVAPFSWFIGAGIAGAVYWMVAKRHRTVVMPEHKDNGNPQEPREE